MSSIHDYLGLKHQSFQSLPAKEVTADSTPTQQSRTVCFTTLACLPSNITGLNA